MQEREKILLGKKNKKTSPRGPQTPRATWPRAVAHAMRELQPESFIASDDSTRLTHEEIKRRINQNLTRNAITEPLLGWIAEHPERLHDPNYRDQPRLQGQRNCF